MEVSIYYWTKWGSCLFSSVHYLFNHCRFARINGGAGHWSRRPGECVYFFFQNKRQSYLRTARAVVCHRTNFNSVLLFHRSRMDIALCCAIFQREAVFWRGFWRTVQQLYVGLYVYCLDLCCNGLYVCSYH
ncbi:hypothetical protein D3C73_1212120 [compost metagenome]